MGFHVEGDLTPAMDILERTYVLRPNGSLESKGKDKNKARVGRRKAKKPRKNTKAGTKDSKSTKSLRNSIQIVAETSFGSAFTVTEGTNAK